MLYTTYPTRHNFRNSRFTLAVLVVWIIAFCGCDCSDASVCQSETDDPTSGHIHTLVARDDLLNTIDFRSGSSGTTCRDGRLFNKSAMLGFHKWEADSFTVPISGEFVAGIADLGTPANPTPGSSALHAATCDAVRLSIGAEGSEAVASYELPVLQQNPRSVQVAAGHSYAVTFGDRQSMQVTHVFLLRVLSHHAEDSVTIRWRRLR
ncbi:MAG: hypothetical protein AB7I19_03685 [Planctomycetota bacterium]